MSIICTFGGVGSGKTLTTVADMCSALRAGLVVASNIELLDGATSLAGRGWRERYRRLELGPGERDDNPSMWPMGDMRGVGTRKVLIVIDEAAEWLDAFGDRERIEKYASWLRHSSKCGTDVVLIVQHWSLLHRRVRALVTEYRYTTNLASAILPGMGISAPWPASRMILVKRLDRDARTSLARPDLYWSTSDIHGAYKTAAMYGAWKGYSPESAYGEESQDSESKLGFLRPLGAVLACW